MSVPSPPPSTKENSQQVFHQALGSFQSTAANFATMCINDARVRQQYMHDIGKASAEFKSAVLAGRMTAQDAAITVNRLRNEILELSRLRSSPTGRVYATRLKKKGLTLESLADTYARRNFRKAFIALTEPQQTAVYAEIVSAAGRANLHIATGICATTAPLCAGIAAFIGSLLFAFGGDLAFDTAYPKPAVQPRS